MLLLDDEEEDILFCIFEAKKKITDDLFQNSVN